MVDARSTVRPITCLGALGVVGREGRAGGTDEKHAAIKSVEARERARGNSSTI
jgi:hypothetical protein